MIRWEGKTHAPVRYGRVNGELVAEIFKLGTHSQRARNDDVYSVKVLGKELTERFRYVSDAKTAAQNAYEVIRG